MSAMAGFNKWCRAPKVPLLALGVMLSRAGEVISHRLSDLHDYSITFRTSNGYTCIHMQFKRTHTSSNGVGVATHVQ